MDNHVETAQALLHAAYAGLDLTAGDLMDSAEGPESVPRSAWVEKGEWLSLAKQVGAEKVFFVENSPVIVFAELQDEEHGRWLRFFNRVWCMARPQLLFLARDGELSVFNLTKRPARPTEQQDEQRQERLLETIRSAAEVQARLQRFRRDQIESGQLFEDDRFGYDNRADRALIRDLKKVRKALLDSGLSVQHAHSLIGRSIFIRYLEDRGVLTIDYFKSVAEEASQPGWVALVEQIQPDAYLPEDERAVYPRVLADKAFTYSLFRRLARDFNGDMFPISRAEEGAVTDTHLERLRKFLLGAADDTLFFFAYRFNVIPIELISSIYEEFYSVERDKPLRQGSFYTPSSLVEFVLSHTLDEGTLDRKPRVIDPACGSGIFLVETYRRLVRHQMKQVGRRLTPEELRQILRNQIAGIDINPEAVRVAAFSLYLALLHYQEPPDILKTRLPSLTYSQDRPRGEAEDLHYDILVAADAFHVQDKVVDEKVLERFGTSSADVVVGNPPWGDPKGPDLLIKQGKRGAVEWCRENNREVGDRELSQAFVHKTLDLLRDGGRAGLLVSTGVFFKRHDKSRAFRRQWLDAAALRHVVNFAAVRDTFFSGPSHKAGSIAPFASVIFEKRQSPQGHRFPYWSAKKTAFIEQVQVVVLSRADVRIVRQDDVFFDDELWKVYWWGGHRDEALVQSLRVNTTLRDLVGPDTSERKVIAQGFKEATKDKGPAGWLAEFKELPAERLQRYGEIDSASFIAVPSEVHRKGIRTVYEGVRLLIRRGISQEGNSNGKIIARLGIEPFCFRDSVHGVRLPDQAADEAEILLGIVWSSLVRYYVFMTSGSWGMWHHEMKQSAIEKIPVRFPSEPLLRDRITSTVRSLRSLDRTSQGLLDPEGPSHQESLETIQRLETELDDAVFELFELSNDERDLILDLTEVGLDLFYRGMESRALEPIVPAPGSLSGRRTDLPPSHGRCSDIYGYIDAFLEVWEPQLAKQGGRFRWWAIRPDEVSPMLAVVFSSETADVPLPEPSDTLQQGWNDVLSLLGKTSIQPYHARRIFIDGMVRAVTESDIVLIKRNECRLWTRSAAREDAEATLLQIIRRRNAAETDEVASVPAQPL